MKLYLFLIILIALHSLNDANNFPNPSILAKSSQNNIAASGSNHHEKIPVNSDKRPGNDPPKDNSDTIDDLEEIENDLTNVLPKLPTSNDENEYISSPTFHNDRQQIKTIWKEMIKTPPLLPNLTDIDPQILTRPNGTNQETLYLQLLTQFMDPLQSLKKKVHWLDQEFVLSLKGLAIYSLFPHIYSSFPSIDSLSTKHIHKIIRIRYHAPEKPYTVELLLAQALSHSLQAKVLFLNAKILEKVEYLGKQLHLSKRSLQPASLINALFDVIDESSDPIIVIINDNLEWLTHNQAMSELWIEEMKHTSKSMFMTIESNGLKPTFLPNNGGNNNNEKESESPPVSPNMTPYMPQSAMTPNPSGLPGPIMRGFQVVVHNGTTTMTPLPPGSFPMPPPNMMNFPNKGPGVRFPLPPPPPNMFPPDMSEEEVQEFLQDPENQTRIKQMVDNMIQNLNSQMGPQSPFLNGQPVDVKMHMMQVPMPYPPPGVVMQRPKLPTNKTTTPTNLPNAQTKSKGGISDAGKQLLMHFTDDLVLTAPQDPSLQTLWNRFIEEEFDTKISKLNKRIFLQESKKLRLFVSNAMLMSLIHHNLPLKKHLLPREQVKDILQSAWKYQIGSKSFETVTNKDEARLRAWSLQLALNSILRASGSVRMFTPTGRSKEEINQLNLDKYEKALLNNVIGAQDIGVSYEMIGGLEEVKEMLRESVTYPLKYPALYQEGIANEAVKGVLLFGPPGTGKTMLAKAVATEGGATFLTVDASTIENKWLGESEKNARAVFTLARKLAPCVVYLDEVDSILSSREHGDESSHGTLTSVKTTLMQEWDGLRTTKDRVVVIASTNRPFDLDEAVLRRLPRRILVDLPDAKTRAEILAVTLAHNRLHPEVNLTTLAQQLDGFTGSDLKEICREAVVRVSHEQAVTLEQNKHQLHQQFDGEDMDNNEDTLSFDEEKKIDSMPLTLRPVMLKDFQIALKKLKASIDEHGRELQKVIEWNEKYGEFKGRDNSRSKSSYGSTMNMFV